MSAAVSAPTTPPTVTPTAHASAASAVLPPAGSRAGIVSYPHDITAFTEGLVYDHGVLFESTGLYGESKLRKVDLASGRVIAQVRMTADSFGEGLALLRGELFQLTYTQGRCFVYDAETLQRKRELRYDGEGWGLTTDGTRFVMSDGSATLTFRDATTFAPVRKVTVMGGQGPVVNLNELEWVDGFVMANVWGTNALVRIDPDSGRVVQTVDLAYLPEPRRGATDDDVLNGIAYDAAGGRLFVTGKRWSRVFQIAKPWGVADSGR